MNGVRVGRHRLTGIVVIGVAALVAACGSPDAPADFVPTVAASESPAAGTAPVVAGVPPCPSSVASVPKEGAGATTLPATAFDCLTAGPSVRLSGLRGTPTVISIWASWCAPCREEFPYLVDLQTRADGEVRVLGIDVLDRPTPARAAVEDFGMNFPSVSDPDGSTKRTIGYPGPPVTLFVDADGVVTYKKIGQLTSQAELDRLVDEHLGVQVR